MSTRSSHHLVIFALALLAARSGAQPVKKGVEMELLSGKETEATTTERPHLVIEELEPMRYHFVTEHRPTSMGQNYYLKPGQLVGSVVLDSDSLQVRHEQDDGKPVASKHNILYVAYAKDLVEGPGVNNITVTNNNNGTVINN
ncbi:uncharacterized protein [Drosophila takahashii]|uniref:uncharacterized protein n=1 Tax=Drosophila takahashii TaxID=29030 RepID=UPI0038996558